MKIRIYAWWLLLFIDFLMLIDGLILMKCTVVVIGAWIALFSAFKIVLFVAYSEHK